MPAKKAAAKKAAAKQTTTKKAAAERSPAAATVDRPASGTPAPGAGSVITATPPAADGRAQRLANLNAEADNLRKRIYRSKDADGRRVLLGELEKVEATIAAIESNAAEPEPAKVQTYSPHGDGFAPVDDPDGEHARTVDLAPVDDLDDERKTAEELADEAPPAPVAVGDGDEPEGPLDYIAEERQPEYPTDDDAELVTAHG